MPYLKFKSNQNMKFFIAIYGLHYNKCTVREANFEQEGNFVSSNKVLFISLS